MKHVYACLKCKESKHLNREMRIVRGIRRNLVLSFEKDISGRLNFSKLLRQSSLIQFEHPLCPDWWREGEGSASGDAPVRPLHLLHPQVTDRLLRLLHPRHVRSLERWARPGKCPNWAKFLVSNVTPQITPGCQSWWPIFRTTTSTGKHS